MHKKGSVLGGTLLLTGSVTGAGMLGLPIMSGLAGFFPSIICFFFAWAFMSLTGLLLVEVNGWFSNRVNLITMVGRTLGKKGKAVCWTLYLFLFYSLLLAYIAGMGGLTTKILGEYFNIAFPTWAASLIFVLVFGWIIYLGTRPVDLWNRVMMGGKIAAFLCLVFLGAQHIQPALLKRSEPQFLLYSIPILVIAFGFHNLIPSLTNYFHNDVKKVRFSIIFGGLLALILYLIWDLIVLGIVPLQGESGILASLKNGNEAVQSLVGVLGSSAVSTFASILAFFAFLTSFLAQSLSLSHFLADGLKVDYKTKKEGWLVILALFPPLLFAILYPNIFLKALNFAGGICAVILFGILPVLMVWRGRYKQEIKSHYRLFGGKLLLSLLFLAAAFIAFFQLSSMFHAPYLPKF